MVCTSGVCTPNHKNAVLNITDLQNLLATSNVTVTTGTGSLAAQTLDIIVNGAVTWASGSALTLDAYQSVTINKSISVTGTGGVSLVTDDGGTGGALSFGTKGNVDFSNLTSTLTINGAPFTLVGDISTLASDIAANASGDYALAHNYDASADGTYTTPPIPTLFNGTLIGLGNTISNFSLAQGFDAGGLFLDVDHGGAIEFLHLAKVDVSGHGVEGGLAGGSAGLLLGDSVSGRVATTVQEQPIGGLVGLNEGVVVNCWSTTAVTGARFDQVGGLVGWNDSAMVTNSYATGAVAGRIDTWVGGLVGYNTGAISNSYATGAVTVGDETFPTKGMPPYAGGLVGNNSDTISNSYSTGSVTGGTGSVLGGFVGFDGSSEGISDAYWDMTTSGIASSSQGAGNIANDSGITGETTSQLQAALPSGFTSTIWAESPTINGGLPYLLANPPP